MSAGKHNIMGTPNNNYGYNSWFRLVCINTNQTKNGGRQLSPVKNKYYVGKQKMCIAYIEMLAVALAFLSTTTTCCSKNLTFE